MRGPHHDPNFPTVQGQLAAKAADHGPKSEEQFGNAKAQNGPRRPRSGRSPRNTDPHDVATLVLGWLADELDQLARVRHRMLEETSLATARWRSSLRRHAALVGYGVRESTAGEGFQSIQLHERALPVRRQVPCGTQFLQPARADGPAIVFETTATVEVCPRWNGWALPEAVPTGARRIAWRDARGLGLPPGAWLCVGDGPDATLVCVQRVEREHVVVRDPLPRGFPACTPVHGNLVPIREGRTVSATLAQRGGATVEELGRSPFLRARIRQVLDTADALCAVGGSLHHQPAWRRAQEHLRAVREVLGALAPGRAAQELAWVHTRLRQALKALHAVSMAVGLPFPTPGVHAQSVPERVPVAGQRVPLDPALPLLWDGHGKPLIMGVHTRIPGTGESQVWEVRSHLFHSGSTDRHVVVEVNERSAGTLCFGDGEAGMRLPPGARLEVAWVTGPPGANGLPPRAIQELGPVGACAPCGDAVRLSASDVSATFNPAGIRGSRGPESRDDILAQVARIHREVQSAAARIDA